ncbi:MAG: hypothetical protein K2X72_06015 [Reyranella sp.]|nr:hypothetical protein [Reyranella sp.]
MIARSLASACRHTGDDHVGITSKVEASEYNNSLLLLDIKQAERESAHDRSTHAANHKLIEARAVRYASFDPADFVEKQATHARTSPFVSSRNADDFEAGTCR